MSHTQEFWTEDRINWLERVLRNHQGDAAAEAFLTRLAQCQTIEQKRRLITEELVPTLQYVDGVTLWEGREIPTRVVLRDIMQDFLYHEGITEDVPTNEPDTPEEAAERERLARLFSQGKSAAEIVIEDRGPR
jgi:hypothetical protein